MIRKISFTDTGAIRVESEISTEIISSGVVLLTWEQAEVAMMNGWKLVTGVPYTNETEPPLYAVKKGGWPIG